MRQASGVSDTSPPHTAVVTKGTHKHKILHRDGREIALPSCRGVEGIRLLCRNSGLRSSGGSVVHLSTDDDVVVNSRMDDDDVVDSVIIYSLYTGT